MKLCGRPHPHNPILTCTQPLAHVGECSAYVPRRGMIWWDVAPHLRARMLLGKPPSSSTRENVGEVLISDMQERQNAR